MKKVIFLSFIFLSISFNAFGHAKLDSSDPEAFEKSLIPIEEIVLEFNEPIKFLKNSSNIINSNKDKINYSYKLTDNILYITPEKILNNDEFKFFYNIISSDGHPISGILPFSINKEITTSIVEKPKDYLDRYLELLIILFIIYFIFKSLVNSNIKKYIFLYFVILIIARFINYYQIYSTSILQIGEVKSNIIYLLSGILFYIKIKYNLQLALFTLALSGLFSGHHLLIESNLKYLFSLHLVGGFLWFASVLAIKYQLVKNNNKSLIKKYSNYATFAIILLIPSSLYLIYNTVIIQLNDLGIWEYNLVVKSSLVLLALAFGSFNHIYIRKKSHNKKILNKLLNLEIIALLIVAILSISLSLNIPKFSTNEKYFSVTKEIDYNQGIKGILEIKNTKDLSIISLSLPETIKDNLNSIEYHIMGNTGMIKHLSGNININSLDSQLAKLPEDTYNITIKIIYNDFEEIIGTIPKINLNKEMK
jgi:methionine-rich copper-binding protein CopC